MMQQTFSLPINQQVDASSSYDESSLRKRKLSFPSSFDIKGKRMATKKKKKRKRETPKPNNSASAKDFDFSFNLELTDISLSSPDNDDVFDWMENILGGGNGARNGTNKDKSKKTQLTPSCDENVIDSLLTLNESDPCYGEMISLLAEDDNNDDNENVFKKIQESFICDRLPECHSASCTKSRSGVGFSKTLQRSPSFNARLARSSRIGIRAGYDQLVKANRLTARTRYMLLTCKPTFLNTNSQ